MRKNKWFVFSLFLFLIPFVLDILVYNRLPSQVPTHFNVNGQVDGTMPKMLGLFGIWTFCFILHVVCCFVTMADPKRTNIPDMVIRIICMICPVIALMVNAISVYCGLGYTVDVNLAVNITVTILIVILGNYLPKVKRNYVVGIKTSWALNSDENWHRTNRFGGYCMVITGILYFVLSLFNMYAGIVALLIGCILPTIYSYILFRQGI